MFLFKKIVVCCFSALLISTLSFSNLFAATLTGKITGIKGDEFYIEMSSKELPRKGDMVSIILDLDGEGFEAGKAEVIEASKSRVTAKTTEGNASIDMKVLIQTAGPSARYRTLEGKSTPPVHRCDELVGDPYDYQRIGPSVEIQNDDESIDVPPIVVACEDAVKSYPKTGRFLYQLGRAYTLDKQYKKALHYYRQASEQEYVAAQNMIGLMYSNGQGTAENDEEAVKWYRKAAEQGYALAQGNMGDSYEYGTGVAKDYAEAVGWYRKAAERGYNYAQNRLGVMYDYGKGVSTDDVEAVKWYRKAAEQGHRSAQYNLAGMYNYGEGVAKDEVEAAKWYRKAADKGHTSAQSKLGWLYIYGKGVSQNYKEAIRWLRKAAEKGSRSAQNNLGTMYENGYGVEKNLKEAVKWYKKAADKGSEDAKKNLSRLGY